MNLPNINSFRKISQKYIFIGIIIFFNNYVNANTFNVNAYKPIQMPLENRKELPKVIREKLSSGVLNIIETSPATVLSPKSKMGFTVQFSHSINDNYLRKYEVSCRPLESGLYQCSKWYTDNKSLIKITKFGVYAFGGLVPLFLLGEYNGDQYTDQIITNIRYDSIMKPGFPLPGLDITFDYTSYKTSHRDEKFYNIRCIKSSEKLTTPQALLDKGDVTVLVCGYHEPPNRLNYSSDIPDGTLYFWLNDVGVALPAALFYPNQLKGSGTGYFHLWQGLINGDNPNSNIPAMQKILDVKFSWIKTD